MGNIELDELTVHELITLLKEKKITRKEIAQKYLENIEKYDKDVNAFVDVYNNLDEFEKLDNETEVGEYAGIPIGIKNNINIKGKRVTCSSKMLENFVSPFDATVIEKLNKENIIPIGSLNMDEFAMGGSTETSYFGITRNPWDLSKVPGGSSGGSASAVATNMVPWALGSDTGGSIRQPASFCGVVGLKPTYGLVSRNGLVAFASSLDQIGPITKDVRDSAMLLNLIAGKDERDSTSVNIPKVDYVKNLEKSIKGKKIAVPSEFLEEGINPEVKSKIEETIELLRKMGAVVEYVSLDIAKASLATYYIIACAEASSNLGRFDGIRYTYKAENFKDLKDLYKKSRTEGFGSEVKRRILLGTYVLSSGYYDAYYKKAQKVRTYVTNKFNKVFEEYDVILSPTSPTTAFSIGQKTLTPLEMYMADIYTVSVNIAGLPGISIPVGVDSENLPIGIQLIGKKFGEAEILNCAYNLEQEIQFRKKYTPSLLRKGEGK